MLKRQTILAGSLALAIALPLALSQTATAESVATSPTAGYLLSDRRILMTAPTSGTAWTALLKVADSSLGPVALADQDSRNPARVLAAALVFARTGQAAYRDKVIKQLRQLPTSSLAGARVLSVGRQLGGYVIAADLIGYRDAAFVSFVRDIRTRKLGGHSRWTALTQTSDDTASNWGAWALASRIAASRFVGEGADVAKAAAVFRRFLGDYAAHQGWRPTAAFDPTWACDPKRWVGVNPPSCGARSGAIVEDISRSAGSYPNIDPVGIMYSWETLGGAVVSAKILSRAGYADVYQWGHKALLRAGQFLYAKSGTVPPYSTNQHVPWALNRAYNVNLGPVKPAGYGRMYGFTDWLA